MTDEELIAFLGNENRDFYDHFMRFRYIDPNFKIIKYARGFTAYGNFADTLTIAYYVGDKYLERTDTFITLTQRRRIPTRSQCKSCAYYHGKQGIVCAVHPTDIDNVEQCVDWRECNE